MSALLRRVEAEVFGVLAPRYGTERGRVTYDTKDGTWVCIKKLPVPPRLTRDGRGVVDILILIPDSYPQVPPDGFYCDMQLRIENHYIQGWRDRYYPQLQEELLKRNWQWFCFHTQQGSSSGWRATSDVKKGDNLHTYLRMCLAILGTEARKV